MFHTTKPDERAVSSPTASNPEPRLLREPYRVFQVLKTTSLGLGAPQGFAIMIHPVGGRALSPSPAYHSSRLMWTHQRVHLPPSFDLYPGGDAKVKHTVESQDKVGSVHYLGWEGTFGLKCRLEVVAKEPTFEHENDIPESETMRTVQIKRQGIGRAYEMQLGNTSEGSIRTLWWKGSKSAVDLVHNEAPVCNGNLKLIDPNDRERILAVWKNRTDPTILGALFILDEFDEGNKGLLEEVVTSCMAIVLAERLSGRGWLGGLGKGTHWREV